MAEVSENKNSVFTSGSDLIVGRTNNFFFGYHCYDLSYTHDFSLLLEDTYFSVDGFVAQSNYDVISGSLSDDMLSKIGAKYPFGDHVTLIARLETYDNGTLVGTDYYGFVLWFYPEHTSPTLQGVTYYDTNDAVASVLGSDQFVLRELSDLVLNVSCEVQYGALINSVHVSTPSKSKDFTSSSEGALNPNALHWGETLDNGNIGFGITVTDSRGNSAYINKEIAVIPYNSVRINSADIRRATSVSTTAQISLSAKRSVVAINDVDKNSKTTVRYRIRLSSASTWGAWEAISRFQDNDGDITLSSYSVSGFDIENAYSVEIRVADTWTEDAVILDLYKGRASLFFSTNGNVGVGTVVPQSPLDVDGEIRMNGFPVLGTQNANLAASADLNDITAQGLYFARFDAGTIENHYPVKAFGMLEVFAPASTMIYQRFTDRSNPAVVYARTCINGTWSDWSSNS